MSEFTDTEQKSQRMGELLRLARQRAEEIAQTEGLIKGTPEYRKRVLPGILTSEEKAELQMLSRSLFPPTEN